MLKRTLTMLILLSALPLAVQADPQPTQTFKYTYVEGGFASVNPSSSAPRSISPAGSSSSLTGLEADGSYALSPDWHAIAGVSHVSCCSVSENVFDAGVGWNTSLASNLDLYIDGEVLSTNVSGAGTHTGWAAEGGLRAQIAQAFELDGFANHSSINSNTENTLGVRGLYAIDMFWHLFASYSNNSDQDMFLVGVRYVF